MRGIRSILAIAAVLLTTGLAARGADALPPKPAKYVTDQAAVLSAATVDALNAKLTAFERETSNQVVVAIYPELPADASLEDYVNRTFHAWGIGQKDKNNGVALFVFVNSHQMRIEVGYGLEGAIPDATANAILTNVLRPAFRSGDYNGGVTRGVDAILAAARGEYHGTGRTNAENAPEIDVPLGALVFIIVIVGLVIFGWIRTLTGGKTYGRKGRSWSASRSWSWTPSSGWSGGSSGGGWSSGGGDSGGGFSGGGGDSGGGGASGSW